LGLQLVGIGSGVHRRFGVEVLGPLAGDPDGGADPLGEGGQPEPSLLGVVGAFRQGGHRGLVGGQLSGRLGQPCGGLVVLATQRGLDVVGSGEFGAACHQVVGGQP
jgi:hypothetical protein